VRVDHREVAAGGGVSNSHPTMIDG